MFKETIKNLQSGSLLKAGFSLFSLSFVGLLVSGTLLNQPISYSLITGVMLVPLILIIVAFFKKSETE